MRVQWINRAIVLLATVALVAMLHQIGWSTVGAHLGRLGWAALFIVGCGLGEALFDGAALREATLGKVGFWRAFVANQAGALVNSVVPAEGGEALKASLLAERAPGYAAQATLVWNVVFRLTKPIVVTISALLGLTLLSDRRDASLVMTALAVASGVLYLVLVWVIRRGWIGAGAGKLSRLPFLAGERAEKLAGSVRRVELAAHEFREQHPPRYRRLVVYQLMARVVSLVTVWVTLTLLGSNYPFALCALIYAGMELIGYILPLLPTRVGTTEGAAFLLFQSLGLDGGLGIVFQLVVRLRSIVTQMFGITATLSSRARNPG